MVSYFIIVYKFTIHYNFIITESVHFTRLLFASIMGKASKRRNIIRNQAKNAAESDEPLLDEDDQELVISQIQEQHDQQLTKMAKFLSATSYIAAIICCSTEVWHEFESPAGEAEYRFWYPLFAACLHIFAGWNCRDFIHIHSDKLRNNKTNQLRVRIGLILAITPMIIHVYNQNDDMIIWAIGGSNIYTMGAVHMMVMDDIQTNKSMDELRSVKYKHKSL